MKTLENKKVEFYEFVAYELPFVKVSQITFGTTKYKGKEVVNAFIDDNGKTEFIYYDNLWWFEESIDF